ncbi:MAG: hypothetical protein KJ556_06940 [Gammaproteobacteria bacterium]|nr:hypothetical protein [Gammaproteobacteria bacterium]MBU2174846.1 hypothetical protein [Gammaproteobacteria bacterium]MBU2245451.1 hypothetical protein [Gammaproteobacteria bacterium]MBU2394198.1 hypothetical protein [Gammaproteobacteria bacterium]MBU2685051.1 hypothetical protein [Gammaproteobacteria bacterium]
MFLHHNFNTKLAYWTLAVSSLVGVVTISLMTTQLITNQSATFMHILVSALLAMLVLNTYFTYRLYKLSEKALILCLWLYGVQVVGVETEYLLFSLSFGFQFTFSLSFDSFSLSVNLAALIIWFIVYSALKSVRKQG